MSSDIYKDIILDYYRNPRNFGDLQDPDVRVKDLNPLCGDIIEMQNDFGGVGRRVAHVGIC